MKCSIKIIILTVIIYATFNVVYALALNYPNGTLLRQQGDTKVYVIENGQRRWIQDQETFNAKGYNWGKVQNITSQQMAVIPQGAPLPSVKSSPPPITTYSKPAPTPQPPQQDTNRLNAIKQIYRDVLGREADQGGLNNYYSSNQPLNAIRQSILNSTECLQGKGGQCQQLYGVKPVDTARQNAIKQTYRDVLGREADTSGLNNYYSSNQSLDAIRQSMFNSTECRQGKGGECKQRYGQAQAPQQDINRFNAIKQLYREILGREADTGGLNNYYAGGLSIDAIRQSMLNSTECRQGKGGECKQRYGQAQPPQQDTNRLNAIKQIYRDVLGREADQGGLNNYYSSNQPLNAIRQSMFNSTECRQGKGGECKQRYGQAQAPQQDINRFNAIKQLYREILGREADAGGLNSYYSSNLSIDAISRSMKDSEECKQGQRGDCAFLYPKGQPQHPSVKSSPSTTSAKLNITKGKNLYMTWCDYGCNHAWDDYYVVPYSGREIIEEFKIEGKIDFSNIKISGNNLDKIKTVKIDSGYSAKILPENKTNKSLTLKITANDFTTKPTEPTGANLVFDNNENLSIKIKLLPACDGNRMYGQCTWWAWCMMRPKKEITAYSQGKMIQESNSKVNIPQEGSALMTHLDSKRKPTHTAYVESIIGPAEEILNDGSGSKRQTYIITYSEYNCFAPGQPTPNKPTPTTKIVVDISKDGKIQKIITYPKTCFSSRTREGTLEMKSVAY